MAQEVKNRILHISESSEFEKKSRNEKLNTSLEEDTTNLSFFGENVHKWFLLNLLFQRSERTLANRPAIHERSE